MSTVNVSILDKDYKVSCPPDQETELVLAARHLDKQMREIRLSGKIVGGERIAVMAALNMSHQLLKGGGEAAPIAAAPEDEEAVKKLSGKLDDALTRLKQLEIG